MSKETTASTTATKPKKQETVGPFLLGKTLGEGSMGKVKLGIHRETGQRVAIKILKKNILTAEPKLRRKVEREIAIMRLMDHPHVLHLYDVFQTSKYLFLVMELVEGGELFQYLVKRGRLPTEEAFVIFRQILSSLEYCQQLLICHRDLKPENVLLDSESNVKLADFGMASLMQQGTLLETSCGSPHYVSPEVVKGERYDGMEADIWSLGVILYAMISGKLPFDDPDIQNVLLKVKRGRYQMPKEFSPELQDLIRKMLTVDPSSRIRLSDIKTSIWYAMMESTVGPMNVQENPIGQYKEASAQAEDNWDDQEVLTAMKSLGWDNDKLTTALNSSGINHEKVLYKLIKRRKASGAAAVPPSYMPDLSVSPANPIKTSQKAPDSARGNRPRKNSSNWAPTSWFAKVRKKLKAEPEEPSNDREVSVGLHSEKPLGELIMDIERVLQKHNIPFKHEADNVFTATTKVNGYDVEFNVIVSVLPAMSTDLVGKNQSSGGGALIRLVRQTGDENKLRNLFEQLKSSFDL
eukprot:gb/GECH01000234.1/.p1 GENE.gb/GECH01000234.1/~~gb/GECH01000234.1/.p1  ORF type:complete len:522 (+),score=119.99 gb/GECH01000234.1/:1-1566(+)